MPLKAGSFEEAESLLNAPQATARPAKTCRQAWQPHAELDSERQQQEEQELACAMSPQPDMSLPVVPQEMETPALPGQHSKAAQQPFAVDQRRQPPQVRFAFHAVR